MNKTTKGRPNILMLVTHDSGKYFGCYGRGAKSSAIDRLSEEGIRFDHYYCPAPQCSPSRGSIITGLYPHNHGLIGLAHMGFSLHRGIATLPNELRKSGYETLLFGFNHEKIEGAEQSKHALGYDRVIEIPGERAETVAFHVESFLREYAKASDQGVNPAQAQHGGQAQPFYASVGFFETHRPFDEYEADDHIDIPPCLPDTPKVRQDMAQFHGSVKALDRGIGRIVQALEDTGLADDTVVIFTTDHGIAFPRAKGTLFDAGLESALIVRWPNGFQGGRVVRELLCNVDLMPTLLELAGVPVPEGLDGRSFLPLLQEQDYAPRESFFCELTWHDRYHPMRGIRTDKYKYIRNFEAGPRTYLPLDIHQSLSGQEVREQYYVPNVKEELYDLETDVLEAHNVIDNTAYADAAQQLRTRVDEWMRETNDPLLQGRVPGYDAPEWQKEVDNGTAFEARSKGDA